MKLCIQAYAVEASIDELLSVVIQRLQALVDFMQQGASLGEQNFIDNLNDGHHLQYLQDIDCIKQLKQHY